MIGDVLRMLAKAADVNIIVGKGVTGEISSLTLREVSVEDALKAITEANGYYWRRDGNIYFVTSEPPPERTRHVSTARLRAAGQRPGRSAAERGSAPPETRADDSRRLWWSVRGSSASCCRYRGSARGRGDVQP